ncbi:MAG: MFS transporter [Actinomycetota bacterium]
MSTIVESEEVTSADSGPSMRTFFTVWAGQLVSLVGTNLTAFGLSIFVFQKTGSVTLLATVMLASQLPQILITPFAGTLVDRWDRRKAMILSDAGAALGTFVMIGFYLTGTLEVWNIAIAVGIAGLFQAFQWPAYSAAMAVVVPKEHFGRASGLVQLAEAVGQLGGPILAGFAIAFGGIAVIFTIDVITFLVAIGTLLIVRFPAPEESAAGAEGAGTVWEETKYGFRYVYARRGLFALLIYFSVVNLAFGFVGPLFIPYGLSLTSEIGLGTASTTASIGVLVGSIVASTWGGPKRRVAGLVIGGVILGSVFSTMGIRPSIVWAAAVLFIGMAVIPTISATSQAIWLAKVEADLQGRIAAVRRFVAQGTLPLAYVLVGPLSDRVFEPLMAADGALAGTVGSILGTGHGRGYALLFAVIGIVVAVSSILAWAYRPLRYLERDIPDVAQKADTPAPEPEPV